MIKYLKIKVKENLFKPLCRVSSSKSELLSIEKIKNYEIGVYFASPVSGIYQLEQWFPIFTEFNKEKKILIVIRAYSTYKYIVETTDFDVVYIHSFTSLVNTYESINLKVIFYVNNGVNNFQSLKCNRVFHIHINHGESNKKSTVSNQVNAYNYIYIVSQAAYDKYQKNLLEVNMNKFIQVGRPQLEHIEEINFLKIDKKRKIILYAPTWEGNHDSDNHTSINLFGDTIIDTFLNDNNYFLIYKPHPYTGIRKSEVKRINNDIIKRIKKSKNAIYMDKEVNILSLYKEIDLAIFDNSAIAVDYLYINKPYVIMNKNLFSDDMSISIFQGGKNISKKSISNLKTIINNEILYDTFKDSREKVKKYFLGEYNYKNKESTEIFKKTTIKLIELRDKKIKK